VIAASAEPIGSLYVHVPFCARKCAYCAFYSEASDGAVMNRFVDALCRDLETNTARVRPETIFFGGGTPSLLTLHHWRSLFAVMNRVIPGPLPEWTIECNPATVSLDKARLWREHGVNRVSMGVQSLDEDLLDLLGRVHSRAMVFRSYDILRRAGFDNVNLDLMFAIPGQTLEIWRATLQEALAMQSEHLSCYEVIYEEDTPLYHQLQAGEVEEDEDLACAMHEALVETAAASGFRQYEVANFARNSRGQTEPAAAEEGSDPPSFACRHNIRYWMGGTYLGLGPGACSYLDGARFRNIGDTSGYCARMEKGDPAESIPDVLSPLARAGEIAAFGLRMNAGWRLDQFRKTTGFDLLGPWKEALASLVREGWGRLTPDRFHLTALGMRFADAAGERFLIEPSQASRQVTVDQR